jgi:hypothetical protein
MKLGIMQPYFFPYTGYFDLIHHTDRWVVFDTPQYIRHGWVNRNRILHPTSGWQYVVAPVRKHSSRIPIREVRLAEGGDWRARLIGQLMHYRKRAPYFSDTVELVEQCLSGSETSLSRLNVAVIETLCARLEIAFDYAYFSEMDIDPAPVEEPGDWALRISVALGADEYVNPPGGRAILDPLKFEAAGVRLTFRSHRTLRYPCRGYEFVPDLSIIDGLMWSSPLEIREHLRAQA